MKKINNKNLKKFLKIILVLFLLSAILLSSSFIGSDITGGYKSSPYFSAIFISGIVGFVLLLITFCLTFFLVLYIGIKHIKIYFKEKKDN